MADFDWGSLASGLTNLWGQYQGQQTANNVNNQVQAGLGQNQAAYGSAIQGLMNQMGNSTNLANTSYGDAQNTLGAQNTALGQGADYMYGQLQNLFSQDSPYMQQARRAIEAKDAAAGRNSQWGDREVQLQAGLANTAAQYSPAIMNSITAARNGISNNTVGLSNIYNNMAQSADRNASSLAQLLSGQLNAMNQANTTGRAASNANTNATSSLLNSGIGALSSLFSGMGNSSLGGISDYYGNQGSINSGITGYGDSIGSMYGYGGAGSLYDNAGYGYGSLPAGDYFGGGGLGGTPTYGGYSTMYDSSLWD